MTYGHILQWTAQSLEKAARPFFLGINGPQGSGKSTLSARLCRDLGEKGLRAIAISIDDFYLTRHHQVQLAKHYEDNPYLQQRGYPGTHDVPLGTKVLSELKKMDSKSRVAVPRYDKSAHQGKGDRMSMERAATYSGSLDLVILEGWMLGFTPVPDSRLPNEHFKVINDFLPKYQAWHDQLNGMIQLKPDDFRHVLSWRVEAEEKMRAGGKPGMSKEEVSRYIELFLPAYETYLSTVKADLVVPIGKGRLPS